MLHTPLQCPPRRVTVELGLSDSVVHLVGEGWDLTIRSRHPAGSTPIAREVAKITRSLGPVHASAAPAQA